MAKEKEQQEEMKQEKVQHQEATFTEAPASFNVKAISPQGYDIMLTLRDSDTANLMARVDGALSWLAEQGFNPTPQRYSTNANASGQQGGNGGEVPLCPTHNKKMLASKHGKGFYCPVKIADDDGTGKPVYCKQQVK